MIPGKRKRRPCPDAPPSNLAAAILSLVDARDALAEQVAGTFVVVTETGGGHHRRRCFYSAAAAEATVRRAEAAGLDAVAFLALLTPMWRLEPPTTAPEAVQ